MLERLSVYYHLVKDTVDGKPAVPRDPKWAKASAAFIKELGECSSCGCKDYLEVHHKKPFHLYPELEMVKSNWIVLCMKPGHICHFIKGHLLNWSAFNPAVVGDCARYRSQVSLRPTTRLTE